MIILLPLVAALVTSYIIWKFSTVVLGKSLALSKVALWVVISTFLIYFVFSGLSFIAEGF